MDATRLSLQGADGLILAADAWGDPGDPPVLFLHGGGQTRHAWGGAAERIAATGWRTISLDLRGHGESDWSPSGDYSITAFAADIRQVASSLAHAPVLVGASLGGSASLHAEAAADEDLSRGLVLVDITPQANPVGVERIQTFMLSGMDGFDTLDDAAAAIAAYTPQRKRATNYEGLKKVLREREGRYYWHWDPALMRIVKLAGEPQAPTPADDQMLARVHVPTLLVRGMLSDIVTDEGVAILTNGIKDVEIVEVGGASHMIAGDKNDQFSDAVVAFLETKVAPRR
jgi:pimeloyl-ACP methyl ester carboxylesterase